MADLVVIVPSRGRPTAVAELVAALEETCTADTELVIAVDSNDPALPGYDQARRGAWMFVQDSHTMVEALNLAALRAIAPEKLDVFAVAFLGDDHRPKTVGWDAAYLDALREFGTGLVYGNDLLQGPRIPTQVAMTADIVRALGYMAPPEFTHLWVDNFWKELGQALGRIRYLPDVVVEHMHPLAGKADWDDGYYRVNGSAVAEHDQTAFNIYMRTRFATDVAKVRQIVGVAA